MKPLSSRWLTRVRPYLHILVILQFALMPLLVAPLAPPVQAAAIDGHEHGLRGIGAEGQAVTTTGGSTPSSSAAAMASIVDVAAYENFFSPREITVTVGTTVRWTNSGAFGHTVHSDTPLFDSGNIAPGGTFTYTFSAAADYPYYCAFHGTFGGVGMSGIVHVVEAPPPPKPNLFVTKTAVPTTVQAGANVTYTIQWGNRVGAGEATGAVITEHLP
ncbi:MAG: hypothetical protein HY331_07560, partial [Chloroflexi bacterium]|nr:hypothetical protein [Chloroflexota bacterium]